MCRLKSGIVLKDRIYIPAHDNHTRMLEELGIRDTIRNAETRFVRFELVPPDGDVFSDIDTWQLKIDQDICPDWFFEEVELPKIKAAVKKWAKKHIFTDKTDLQLPAGGTYYLKNCKNATLYGNSRATLRENSTATLWENSTATLYGNSIAILEDSFFAAERNNITMFDNSTVKDCRNKTITSAAIGRQWR